VEKENQAKSGSPGKQLLKQCGCVTELTLRSEYWHPAMTKHSQKMAKSWKKSCANNALPKKHTPRASSIDITISGTVFLK